MNDWKFSDGLIEWIKSNIPFNSTILELGSGQGSTVLAQDYKIICVEHDKEWLDKYSNIEYIYAPLKEHKPVEGFEHHTWYDPQFLNSIKNLDYQTLIIDGPPGCFGRSGFLKYMDLFKIPENLILDDIHREAETRLAIKISREVERSYTINDAWKGKAWAYFHPKNNLK